jgi:LmbE family N-acetylglucosaminyl deacetylase
MLRLMRERDVTVTWVVFGCTDRRGTEARESASSFLSAAREHNVQIHKFRDAFFPHEHAAIKDVFEVLKKQVTPDLIFTHTRHDLHQDHRVVNELTWNTFRDHAVLEYEIPKYDADLGTPNVYANLDEAVVERKIQHLLKFFQTQRDKRWFDEETFRSLLRLRGIEAGTRYAEAFYGRKLLM